MVNIAFLREDAACLLLGLEAEGKITGIRLQETDMRGQSDRSDIASCRGHGDDSNQETLY